LRHGPRAVAATPPAFLRGRVSARTHLIEISFAQHPDAAERTYLSELPMSLALSDEELERTIHAARTILMASPEFQTLLRDLEELDDPR
jgi:hypothetical protein